MIKKALNKFLLIYIGLTSVLFTQGARAVTINQDTTINKTVELIEDVVVNGDDVTVDIDRGKMNIYNGKNFTLIKGTINLSGTKTNEAGINLKWHSNDGSILSIKGGTVNINDYGIINSDSTVDITAGKINLNGVDGIADISGGNAVNINGGTVEVESGLNNYILLGAEGLGERILTVGGNNGGSLNILAESELVTLYQTDDWNKNCILNPYIKGCFEIAILRLDKNATINIEGILLSNIESIAMVGDVQSLITIYDGGVINGIIVKADNRLAANLKLIGGTASQMLMKIVEVNDLTSVGTILDKAVAIDNNLISIGSTISGNLALTKNFIVAKDDTYATTTLKNTLIVGGSVIVNSGATLAMEANLTTGNNNITIVGEGATLNLGIGLLSTGTFRVEKNAMVAFIITSTDSYGKVEADNYDISRNGTMLQLIMSDGVWNDEEKEFEIFKGFKGLDDPFPRSLSENKRYTIRHLENGKYKIVNVASAADVAYELGASDNNIKTIFAWLDDSNWTNEVKGSNAILSAVINELEYLSQYGTREEIEKTLTALAPETSNLISTTTANTFSTVANAVGSRMSGGFSSSSSPTNGMSSGDPKSGLIVWGQRLYNHAKLDGSVKGFEADTNGMVLGVEGKYSDEITLGLSYANNLIDVSEYGRNTNINSNAFIVYGEYKPSDLFFNGILSYGKSSYGEEKDVGGIMVKANHDTHTTALQALGGYELDYNHLNITPTIGLRYISINAEDYIDSVAQRVVPSDKASIFSGLVGVKLNKNIVVSNTLILIPEVKIGVQYDFKNGNGSSRVILANKSYYTALDEEAKKTAFEMGLGLGVNLNNEWHFSLNYDGKFKNNYKDYTILLNVKYGF